MALIGAFTCCRPAACRPPQPAVDDIEPVNDPLPPWELEPHPLGEANLPVRATPDGGEVVDAGADAGSPDAGVHASGAPDDGGPDEEDDWDDDEEDAGHAVKRTCGTDGGAIHCTAECWCSGPSFDSTGPLVAVTGSGSHAWAIGSTLLRFDGRDWEELSSGRRLFGSEGEPFSGGRRPRMSGTALWASSPDDVWMARGLRLVHWDGQQFSGNGGSAGLLNPVSAIWGSSAQNLWAVGPAGTLVHGDGTGWSVEASGTSEALTSVWGSGESDVWAVGTNGLVLHYDGATWAPVDTGITAWLTGVWVGAGGDVWIVGNGGIWRGNRGGFRPVPLGGDVALQGVWGDGAGSVWAVGTGGTILRFEPGGYRSMASGTTLTLRGVSGGDGQVYVVGDSGVLLWHLDER
jgi:hypothetical protein